MIHRTRWGAQELEVHGSSCHRQCHHKLERFAVLLQFMRFLTCSRPVLNQWPACLPACCSPSSQARYLLLADAVYSLQPGIAEFSHGGEKQFSCFVTALVPQAVFEVQETFCHSDPPYRRHEDSHQSRLPLSRCRSKAVGMVTPADVEAGRWRTRLVILCLVFESPIVMPVLSQGTGSQSGPVSFMANYESQSDAQHFRVLNNGQQVQLVLDEYSAAGFGSKYKYLFGKIGMRMKLVPGNSAGTVTAYYMSSQTPGLHDEMDFEFLGNVSGQPYILQTNVYANGQGNREQRIYLWFDPTTDFHSYSILWNKQQIIFYVDDTPIRVYKNNEDIGVPYPESKPVGIYSTIWNGENWATNDGWTKLNWTYSPFVASYESFAVDACVVQNDDTASCIAQTNSWWAQSEYQTLADHQVNELEWVRKNFLLYDYCADRKRSPTAPPECARNPL